MNPLENLSVGSLPIGMPLVIAPQYVVSGTDLDPTSCADEVAKMWHFAAKATVGACKLLLDALRAFVDSEEKQAAFFRQLVQHGVISSNDELGKLRANGKLSMMKKIGEHADFLMRDEILPLLPTGYSAIYHYSLLIERVGAESAQRWLESLGTEPTRDDIIGAIRTAASESAGGSEPESSPSADLGDDTELFAMDASAPGARQLLKYLETDLQALDGLRLSQPADRAGLVILCRTNELMRLQSDFVPLLGFSKPRIALLDRPARPDISDAKVVLIATRGDVEQTKFDDFPGERVGLLSLTEQAFPYFSRRLALFSSEKKAGWQILGHRVTRTARAPS